MLFLKAPIDIKSFFFLQLIQKFGFFSREVFYSLWKFSAHGRNTLQRSAGNRGCARKGFIEGFGEGLKMGSEKGLSKGFYDEEGSETGFRGSVEMIGFRDGFGEGLKKGLYV